MKQAIAGVAHPNENEVTVMVVWPSNARYRLGRFHGRLYQSKKGAYIFTLGNLMCLLTIPGAIALYIIKLLPSIGKRYAITNRRVVEYKSEFRREPNKVLGLPWPIRFHYQVVNKSVELDRFDSIDIEVLPGQEWYHAGDLVFTRDGVETFRLEGVGRPEAFRQVCLKSRQAYVGVKQALEQQAVAV